MCMDMLINTTTNSNLKFCNSDLDDPGIFQNLVHVDVRVTTASKYKFHLLPKLRNAVCNNEGDQFTLLNSTFNSRLLAKNAMHYKHFKKF